MPIELANIQLNRVHKVDTLEQAALVHHRVPGMEGNVTQNVGRDSVRLQIEGIFYGARAGDDLETLRKAYKAREPVDFLADIVGQAYFAQVVLETFEVVQAAIAPDQFSYRLTIAEFVPPQTSAAQNTAAVNEAVQLQAQAMMDVASLPDVIALGSIPELTNPAEPLNGAMGQISTATEGLSGLSAGFNELSAVQATATETPPPTVTPAEPELTWQASETKTEDLLKAGVPTQSLLEQGATAEELLAAGATTHQLLADGVTEAELTEAGVPPEAVATAQQVRATLATEPEPFKVAIAFTDPHGLPFANQPYEIALPDGTQQTGTLDAQGRTMLAVISTGDCAITFPELGADVWTVYVEPEPELSSDTEETVEDSLPSDTEAISLTGWVTLQIEDDDGNPLRNATYQITRPDGTVTEPTALNDQGQALLEQWSPGDYIISLPDWMGESAIATGWVTLRLAAPDGTPLSRANYQITQPDGTVTATGTTDTQGQLQLAEAIPGEYQLTVTPQSWITLQITDSAGAPLDGEPFEIRDSAGTVVISGLLGDRGQATVPDLAATAYTLTLLGLEAEAWRLR